MTTFTKLILTSFVIGGLGILSNGIYQVRKDKFDNERANQIVRDSEIEIEIGKIKINNKRVSDNPSNVKVADDTDRLLLRYIGAILGAISLVLAIIACCVSKQYKISSIAASVGLICLAWEYVLIAVGLAFFLIVISALCS
jgi:hypothetical protein